MNIKKQSFSSIEEIEKVVNETRKKMSCLVNRFAHSQAYQKTVAFQI